MGQKTIGKGHSLFFVCPSCGRPHSMSVQGLVDCVKFAYGLSSGNSEQTLAAKVFRYPCACHRPMALYVTIQRLRFEKDYRLVSFGVEEWSPFC